MLRPEPWVKEALSAETNPQGVLPREGRLQEAKQICARCDVSVQCTEYALRTEQECGIWGGLSRMARRDLGRGAAA